MKYYSDVTLKIYDTEEELKEAEQKDKEQKEKEHEEKLRLEEEKKAKAKERGRRAEEVRLAYDKYIEAKENYYNLLQNFCKEYKYYHATIDSKDVRKIFDDMFKFPW